MKSFALTLATVAQAVNVDKARHNPAFAAPVQRAPAHHEPVHYEEVHYEEAQPAVHEIPEGYEIVGDEYETGNTYRVEEPVWEPAPRYWDDHLRYDGPTWVDFSTPKPFKAQHTSYELPKFLPYIPKFTNNYVDIVPADEDQEFGELFQPYDFYSPPEEDVYGDPIYEPKHDKLHGKPPKKEEEDDDHHRHGEEEEEEHHDDEEEEHHDDHYYEVHADEGDYHTVSYDCDCSDVAAQRDAAIVERDQAVSELALYKLAYGDILPEPEHPVYVPEENPATVETYDDQYEATYYYPESTINEDYSDIPYQHAEVTTEYYPTEEELHFFDTEEYSPLNYY